MLWNCYVLMPFAAEFDAVYEVILGAARDSDFDCARADKKRDIGLITQGIIMDILLSDIVVADISGFNPNVLYELGIAHTLSKPTLILSQELFSGGKMPFDITHMTTIPYTKPVSVGDIHARELKNSMERYFSASRIHHNPVSITLAAERLSLANHFGFRFLWGFAKTLEESRRAHDAWVVSTKLYWERLNAQFYRNILEERILLGKRKELVLLPDNEENRYRKNTVIERYEQVNPHVEEFLRILLVSDSRTFAFLPTEISIYDAGTYDVRAIVLEPMAVEGMDHENDTCIAAALNSSNTRDLRLHNLRADVRRVQTGVERRVHTKESEEMVTVRDQSDTFMRHLRIGPRGQRTGVFASCPIPKGAVIIRMQGDLLASPDKFSIQIDTHKHLGKGGLIDDEMNHSCDANAKIEYADLTIRAKRQIETGEEVCINYCATEDTLANSFRCDCGSSHCYGTVRGCRYLSEEERNVMRDELSPFLARKYYGKNFTKCGSDAETNKDKPQPQDQPDK